MQIVTVTKRKDELVFTGVDNKGIIKIGLLHISKVGKAKPEWFTAELVLCQK